MTRGSLGTVSINRMIQEAANPEKEGTSQLKVGERIFRQEDRFIHRRNNYNLGAFNGDIGIIQEIDNRELTCTISFFPDNREVLYQKEDIFELDLAYTVTIHKSQGNEFEIVIIPIHAAQPVVEHIYILSPFTGIGADLHGGLDSAQPAHDIEQGVVEPCKDDGLLHPATVPAASLLQHGKQFFHLERHGRKIRKLFQHLPQPLLLPKEILFRPVFQEIFNDCIVCIFAIPIDTVVRIGVSFRRRFPVQIFPCFDDPLFPAPDGFPNREGTGGKPQPKEAQVKSNACFPSGTFGIGSDFTGQLPAVGFQGIVCLLFQPGQRDLPDGLDFPSGQVGPEPAILTINL